MVANLLAVGVLQAICVRTALTGPMSVRSRTYIAAGMELEA